MHYHHYHLILFWKYYPVQLGKTKKKRYKTEKKVVGHVAYYMTMYQENPILLETIAKIKQSHAINGCEINKYMPKVFIYINKLIQIF